jgi:hypothetical protein
MVSILEDQVKADLDHLSKASVSIYLANMP